MKNTILITLCCASLILVTPFTTIAQENTISNNLPEPNTSNEDLKNLLLQRFVKGEISESVYLLTLKQLDITNKSIEGYQ